MTTYICPFCEVELEAEYYETFQETTMVCYSCGKHIRTIKRQPKPEA